MKIPRMAVLALVAGLALVGCNLFDPFDSPTSDAQLLSAARACFDRGDLACARDNYAKLSAASADIANMELAFAILDQQGATMAAFLGAFGGTGGAKGITKLADSMASGAGVTKRKAVFEAYQKAAAIGDTDLKAFTRFISAISFIAELLAESSGTDAKLQQADLVRNPTSCKATDSAVCIATEPDDCKPPVGSVLDDGASISMDTATASSYDGTTVTTGMFDGAIIAADDALSNLGGSGKISGNTNELTDTLRGVALAANSGGCYLQQMLSLGIGE